MCRFYYNKLYECRIFKVPGKGRSLRWDRFMTGLREVCRRAQMDNLPGKAGFQLGAASFGVYAPLDDFKNIWDRLRPPVYQMEAFR